MYEKSPKGFRKYVWIWRKKTHKLDWVDVQINQSRNPRIQVSLSNLPTVPVPPIPSLFCISRTSSMAKQTTLLFFLCLLLEILKGVFLWLICKEVEGFVLEFTQLKQLFVLRWRLKMRAFVLPIFLDVFGWNFDFLFFWGFTEFWVRIICWERFWCDDWS